LPYTEASRRFMKVVAERPAPQSVAANDSARKANSFDALRLFAALSVVVWHSVRHTGAPLLWIHPGTSAWFFDGVPLFFVMSGMLVYRSCLKCFDSGQPVRSFYVNRFLRVGPALYVYATLTPLFLLLVGAISMHLVMSLPFAEWYVSNLLFCPVRESIFSSFAGSLNGSLWTIPVEVSFYVICPLLVLTQRRFGVRALIGLLLALSVAGLLIKSRYEGDISVPQIWWRGSLDAIPSIYKIANLTFLPYFVFFALGITWLHVWKRASQSGWLALAAAAAYVLIRYQLMPIHRYSGPLQELLWGIPFSYLAVWVGYNAPLWVSKLTKFGDISYGIYIWHMIVVNTVIYLALPRRLGGLPSELTHVIILGCSFAISFASWKLVEKPALKLKPFTTRPADAKAW
jgi:peptidoglycan/LPS O-acetylase OafA/YrhL